MYIWPIKIKLKQFNISNGFSYYALYFSCQFLLLWCVDLSKSRRILAVEYEFVDNNHSFCATHKCRYIPVIYNSHQ